MTIDEIEEVLEAIANLSRATDVKEGLIIHGLKNFMADEDYNELLDLWRANR